jgi:hypothetical protein
MALIRASSALTSSPFSFVCRISVCGTSDVDSVRPHCPGRCSPAGTKSHAPVRLRGRCLLPGSQQPGVALHFSPAGFSVTIHFMFSSDATVSFFRRGRARCVTRPTLRSPASWLPVCLGPRGMAQAAALSPVDCPRQRIERRAGSGR